MLHKFDWNSKLSKVLTLKWLEYYFLIFQHWFLMLFTAYITPYFKMGIVILKVFSQFPILQNHVLECSNSSTIIVHVLFENGHKSLPLKSSEQMVWGFLAKQLTTHVLFKHLWVKWLDFIYRLKANHLIIEESLSAMTDLMAEHVNQRKV